MTLDFDKIDKVIHERGRLAIMTLLATRVRWSFADLKTELRLSDGNLVTHLRTLHGAGYVTVTKEILDRPQTTYALTPRGRKVFQDYLCPAGKNRQDRTGLIFRGHPTLYHKVNCLNPNASNGNSPGRTLRPLLRRARRPARRRTPRRPGSADHPRRSRP